MLVSISPIANRFDQNPVDACGLSTGIQALALHLAADSFGELLEQFSTKFGVIDQLWSGQDRPDEHLAQRAVRTLIAPVLQNVVEPVSEQQTGGWMLGARN